MKQNQKWTSLLAACTVMLMLLTACGESPQNSGGTGGTPDSASSAQPSSSQSTESETNQNPPAGGGVSGEVTEDNFTSFPATEESLFTVEHVEGGVSVTGCSADSKVIVVPEEIGGETVVGISSAAFFMMEMQAVVLPDTVKTIGNTAFALCESLTYIDLGKGLETIEAMAFTECPKLLKVAFPEGMTTMGDVLFYGCDELTEVVVPDSVTNILVGIFDPTTCPNAVVVTPKGSTAETLCTENDIPYRNS